MNRKGHPWTDYERYELWTQWNKTKRYTDRTILYDLLSHKNGRTKTALKTMIQKMKKNKGWQTR